MWRLCCIRALDPAGLRGWQQAAKDIRHCFSKVLNGRNWDRGTLTHLCSGCCRTRQEAEAKATRAIGRVLMRCLPCVPLLSDWSKLGPNLDFWMASEFQGVLSALLERAPWATELPRYDGNEDVVFISWQKLAGSRFHRTQQMLSNHQERFRRTLLTLVVEPPSAHPLDPAEVCTLGAQRSRVAATPATNLGTFQQILSSPAVLQHTVGRNWQSPAAALAALWLRFASTVDR